MPTYVRDRRSGTLSVVGRVKRESGGGYATGTVATVSSSTPGVVVSSPGGVVGSLAENVRVERAISSINASRGSSAASSSVQPSQAPLTPARIASTNPDITASSRRSPNEFITAGGGRTVARASSVPAPGQQGVVAFGQEAPRQVSMSRQDALQDLAQRGIVVANSQVDKPQRQGFVGGVVAGAKFGARLGIGAGSTQEIRSLGENGRTAPEFAGVLAGTVAGGAFSVYGVPKALAAAAPAVGGAVRSTPVLGPAVARLSAARSGLGGIARFGTDVATVGVVSYGSALGAERVFVRGRSVSNLSSAQELSIAREGRFLAEQRAGRIRGSLSSAVSGNVFISRKEQIDATADVIKSRYDVSSKDARIIATNIASRSRNVLGSTEIGTSIFVAERAGEAGVRVYGPRAFEFARQKGVRFVGERSAGRAIGVLATSSSAAGILEGVGESISSQRLQTGRVSATQVGVTALAGGATAGLFTRFVQAPNILADIGIGKVSRSRRFIERGFYVVEPYEKPGDIAQDIVQSGAFTAPRSVSFRRTRAGTLSLSLSPGGSSPSPGTGVGLVSGSRTRTRAGVVSSTRSSSGSRGFTGSFSQVFGFSRTGTRVGAGTGVGSGVGSGVGTSVGTTVGVGVGTGVGTAVNVASGVVTPPFFIPPIPRLPEGGGNGRGSGRQASSKRTSFAPDFTAAFFDQRASKSSRRVGGSFGFGGFERRLL